MNAGSVVERCRRACRVRDVRHGDRHAVESDDGCLTLRLIREADVCRDENDWECAGSEASASQRTSCGQARSGRVRCVRGKRRYVAAVAGCQLRRDESRRTAVRESPVVVAVEAEARNGLE